MSQGWPQDFCPEHLEEWNRESGRWNRFGEEELVSDLDM